MDAWVGQKFPQATLKSTEGHDVDVPKSFHGKWTVLYFYPKDDTPGCTKQACTYRDSMEAFKEHDILVYGVSLDDIESHQAFQKKFTLNFPLLVDQNHKLSQRVGTYSGAPYLSRDTFLIDPAGVVRGVWRKSDPERSVDEVLRKATELMGQ